MAVSIENRGEMNLKVAQKFCLQSLILPGKPDCELLELYRWKDHGVDHIIYMGLDGHRYKLSNQTGLTQHWEICAAQSNHSAQISG